MPTVPEAALRRAFALALVALCGALLACGAEEDGGEPAAQGVGEVKVGSVAALAQCRDWNRGTEEEKLATIADIRAQINLEDAPVDAPSLSDDEAFEVFENACAAEFADGFRLYKLYANAASFAPLTR